MSPAPTATEGPRVILVGVPGAGKSTVGRALATALDLPFRDTDEDIVRTSGRSVADIFVQSGEADFRALEVEAVSVALTDHRGILSLGGGAILDSRTRAALSGRTVVWLRVGLPAAAERAGLSAARPVLLGNIRGQLKDLMAARAPLYEEVASLVLDTDQLSVDDAVARIVASLDDAQSPRE